ncbi:MAG: Gfo/Idh/MocA family oxidoreductase [Acidobacteria bacterium]|nr:Gfo/Idh/MocA family oxidoreductase [Acidobacteriota bacterium]
MDSPKLRGAIIGCGFFAQFQIEAWRRMPEVELAAACDLDPGRARAAAPRPYTSAEELLRHERVDFVDIATRPDSHLELVSLAVSHGIPVICQKPMAPRWEDCRRMVEAAESAGVPLMIHENWRWQPWYRELARLIAGGAVGTPVAYTFRTRRQDGLGEAPYSHQPYFRQMPRLLIYETLVHQIDTARFLFGEIASVFARARRVNPVIAGEDQALLLLAHENGLPGVIDGHRFLNPDPDGPAMGEAWIEGDAGALTLRATGDIWQQGRRLWENTVTEGYRGDSVRATQQHFVDRLRAGTSFESEGREYLKTVAAVEASYRSIAENRVVAPLELLSCADSAVG